MNHYDYIILGGGLAGLSLACQLIDSSLRDRTILIVEPDDKDRNDRTFCFWSDRPTPFDAIVHRSWDQIQLVDDQSSHPIDLGAYRYHMIRGLDFYQHAHDVLTACSNVTFIQNTADHIEETADGAFVTVGGQRYFGRWIFDSRFKVAAFKADPANADALYQHFTGWLIETLDDAFDPSAATMFDFRVPQRNELRFCYVLPLSKRQALIEFVALSSHQLESTLKAYVEHTLNLRDYRILEEEGGVSPLTDRSFARRTSAHVMTIGTAGGRIKASSGYAYTRIQDDSTAIVRSLIETGQPFNVPADSPFFRLCDALLLRLMREQGATLQAIFVTMFQRNPAARIFRFLDETAAIADVALFIAHMPPRPFLQALYEHGIERIQIASNNIALKIKASHRQVGAWRRENSQE
ncbi:MAG: lycopene cyclase family protein [Anaerolineae bacterium]